MSADAAKEESISDSCRTISYFLEECNGTSAERAELRATLLKDLYWRSSRLPPFPKAVILAESFYRVLPEEIRGVLHADRASIKKEFDALLAEDRKTKDVGIITIIGPELKAVLRALGFRPDRKEDMTSGGYHYWFGEVTRDDGTVVSVVVTMVGKPRNVPCAIAVEHLLSNFKVNLLMLVGIAAGPKRHVRLGDVVCAHRVFDYEHVRLELLRFFGVPSWFKIGLPRPEDFSIPDPMRILLEKYDVGQMTDYFGKLVKELQETELPPMWSADFSPRLHTGTIAAGEKLIADGSLQRMCRSVDQRLRAGDQEDSGFAQVAQFKKLPWCIFRGICDFADPTKNDGWHVAAGAGCRLCGCYFPKNGVAAHLKASWLRCATLDNHNCDWLCALSCNSSDR